MRKLKNFYLSQSDIYSLTVSIAEARDRCSKESVYGLHLMGPPFASISSIPMARIWKVKSVVLGGGYK